MANHPLRFPSPHDDHHLDWSSPKKPSTFFNKHTLVIAAGLCCAILLLVVILNIKSPASNSASTASSTPPEVTELIAPSRLDDSQLRAHGLNPNTLTVDAPKGAWIDITDPKTGRLVQQYRFDRLDPNPPGKGPEWIAMENPQVRLFLQSNRVLLLTGRSAVAHAPNRALVSGSLTGDVSIRAFEPSAPASALPDPAVDAPSLTVSTSQASFDNFLGEVRCDGPVLINHPRAEIPAHDLRILINDSNDTFSLNMAGADYIRIRAAPASAPSPRASSTSPAASRPARAEKSSDPLAPSSSTQPAVSATFYRLVLHDSVRVQQGDLRTGKLLTGDALSIIFSSKTKNLENTTIAARTPPPLRRLPALASPAAAISFSSLAALPSAQIQPARESPSLPQPAPGETLITFTGPLTLEPLADPSLQPPTPADALFSLSGAPVHVDDFSTGSTITCASARYTTADQRIDLLADARHLVRLASADLLAQGAHAWFSQSSSTAGFIGAGWLSQVNPNAPVPTTRHQPPATAPTLPGTADPFVQLKISWTGGVDLHMDPASADLQSRRLRKASFTGNVHVESPELALDAHTMHVGFRPDAADSNSIDSIIAQGATDVHGVFTSGVTADQRTRMLFADSLHVTLLPADQPAASQPVASASSTSLKDHAAQVTLNTLSAKGDVQVLLDDGARVFADDLFADAVNRKVTLTGENIVIARDVLLIDHGSSIEIDDAVGFAHLAGPGQARLLRDPLPLTQRDRIPKPLVVENLNPTQARVRWNSSAHFDRRANADAGALTLAGAVDAVSRPSPLEFNTMTGESLTIHFQHAPNPPASTPASTAPLATQPAGIPNAFQLSPSAGSTIVSRFVASGSPPPAVPSSPPDSAAPQPPASLPSSSQPAGARLENRLQLSPDDPHPRIFYIAGDSIDYHLLTREALISGQGELLIRDLHAPQPSTQPVDNPPLPDAPFSSRGTTHFTWKRQLQLSRTAPDSWTLSLQGDVQGRHLTPDQIASTITAQLVAADLSSIAPPASQPASSPAPSTSIDLGSPLEISRLRCRDAVFIRTQTRDVECDFFEYDLRSRFAELGAFDGRTAAVTTKGSPSVNRAQKMEWNLQRDSIRIVKASGLAPR